MVYDVSELDDFGKQWGHDVSIPAIEICDSELLDD
jgi:hypothetical protein